MRIICFHILKLTETIISNAYRYDIEKKSWSYGTPMKTVRSGFGLATLNNQIYAAGGHSKYVLSQNSVEVYSPVSKTWTYCKPMRVPKNYVEVWNLSKSIMIEKLHIFLIIFYNNYLVSCSWRLFVRYWRM